MIFVVFRVCMNPIASIRRVVAAEARIYISSQHSLNSAVDVKPQASWSIFNLPFQMDEYETAVGDFTPHVVHYINRQPSSLHRSISKCRS